MACNVTITSVTGVPAGPPANPGSISAMNVAGTAANTSIVTVSSECFARGNFQAQVTNGQWQITVPALLFTRNQSACTCGQFIEVTAQATDPQGSLCQAVWTQPLACPTCPTVTVDAPVVGNCVAGFRSVTLTIHVTQAAGQTSVFQWDFGDPPGSFGMAFAITGNGPQNSQHNYAPGTYTANL